MRYAAIAFLLSGLGLGAGWWADSQRHAAEISGLRLQIMQRDLDVAEAQRAAEATARATENAGVRLTQEIDHAYQADLARLARVPARRLRLAASDAAATGAGLRHPALPGTAGGADAATADPVPDPGCDRLAVDAAKTTLMLYRLQQWAAGLAATHLPQGGGALHGN